LKLLLILALALPLTGSTDHLITRSLCTHGCHSRYCSKSHCGKKAASRETATQQPVILSERRSLPAAEGTQSSRKAALCHKSPCRGCWKY
jgi:hypothetical protein